eukprot:Nk52_evm11s1869 gene=Nk52_evmTU11s1869
MSEHKESSAQLMLARWLFVLIGVGYLFPYSAIVQAFDYWNVKFPGQNIEFMLSAVYMYTNLVVLGIMVFFGDFSFSARIIIGFLGQFFVLAFLPTAQFFDIPESDMYTLVLSLTAIVAMVTGLLDSSMLSFVSLYPVEMQQALQIGIGVSSLIGAVYRDVTKLIFPVEAIKSSTILYFYSGAATILVCLLGYFWLLTLPLSKRCLKKVYAQSPQETQVLLNKEMTVEEVYVDRKAVFKKVFAQQFLVCFVFVTTLGLWPAMITEIPTHNLPEWFQTKSWYQLILLTLFSVMDVLGRNLIHYRLWFTPDNIKYAVWARLLFFPLIYMCVNSIIFTHDFFSVLFVSGLGFTNGYLGSLVLVMTNEVVEEHERKYTGTLTSFFLNTGLVLGATLGLVMEKLL